MKFGLYEEIVLWAQCQIVPDVIQLWPRWRTQHRLTTSAAARRRQEEKNIYHHTRCGHATAFDMTSWMSITITTHSSSVCADGSICWLGN